MVFRLPAEGAGLRAGSSQICLGDGCQDEIGWRHFTEWEFRGMTEAACSIELRLNASLAMEPFLRFQPKGIFPSLLGCSVVSDSVTPWSVAHQAPLTMRFSRQEYWSGLPFPSPRDLPKSAIKPTFPVSFELQIASLPTEPSGKPLSFF
ncbi:unnamed protein product [Rangifer tarandus platyrhynchus]|uniref:Uncharacterized protein n=2 Tax=Rangifer tarandus platyrhynchus TaxID=3082113 RepID=A0ABN8ZLH7_RANTA|nr:unnamed protein product [Rangifer tarandus platyrhynchus]